MPVAIIGGSGFHTWALFRREETVSITTSYASHPVEVFRGSIDGVSEILFIPRHGTGHSVPPHRINYRANIRALKDAGASAVVSIAAVGGITARATPGSLMIPDQVLDYTYGREHTFFDGQDGVVAHVDMTEPYCEALRERLIDVARRSELGAVEGGTYAATQGPRFETPAEVIRLERDGADVVGMTGMPEAALAKELQLAYATVALIVNPAAGKAGGGISMEQVREWLARGRSKVEALLTGAIPLIGDDVYAVPSPMQP